MADQALAGAKKNARVHGQTIVFIDESGLSERPTLVRSWAPVGQPPVIQYSFHWTQLSAIAGISFRRFSFRFFPGAIRPPRLLDFLKALRAQIRGRLLIIWDRLNVHRSRLVREWVEAQDGDVQLEFLPAYTPELNPVEGIWNHLKNREIANLCVGTHSGSRQLCAASAALDAAAAKTDNRVLAANWIGVLKPSCTYTSLSNSPFLERTGTEAVDPRFSPRRRTARETMTLAAVEEMAPRGHHGPAAAIANRGMSNARSVNHTVA